MKVALSKKFLMSVLSVLLICLTCFAGCIFGDGGSSSETTNNGNKEKLALSDVSMSVDYNEYLGYSVKIEGTAKNLSGKNYSYASVEYSVYDEAGNNLGTALDNINHLANGDSWKFSATLLGFANTKPSSYKLVDITVIKEF